MNAKTIFLTVMLIVGFGRAAEVDSALSLTPFDVRPYAGIYRLLSAPKELEGREIQTIGFLSIKANGDFGTLTGQLFPSLQDWESGIELNSVYVECRNLPKDDKTVRLIRKITKLKRPILVQITGVFRNPDTDIYRPMLSSTIQIQEWQRR